MPLSRRNGNRFSTNIWPGFVDAITALLLVLTFVLSIFMMLQFTMRETILGQGRELSSLSAQIQAISRVLGLTQDKNEVLNAENAALNSENENLNAETVALQENIDGLTSENAALNTRILDLNSDLETAKAESASFEEQVLALIAKNTTLQTTLDAANTESASLEAQLTALIAQNQEITDAAAVSEEDFQARVNALLAEKDTQGAALADAEANLQKAVSEKDILEALVASLQEESALTSKALASAEAQIDLTAQALLLAEAQSAQLGEGASAEVQEFTKILTEIDDVERQRLAEKAAAEVLRARLKNSDAELTAMGLALEEERKKAEDTLTLLAALDAQESEVLNNPDLSDEEKQQALLDIANQKLAEQDNTSAAEQRQIALLNQQTRDLRNQLGALQTLLDQTVSDQDGTDLRIDELGRNLNIALAKTAAEEKARANSLEAYRSDFFGRLRTVLEDLDGVEIVGDRFVFSSEVLFPVGSTELSAEGRRQIGQIANVLNEIGDEIPDDINWILRVDGHTDDQPVRETAAYKDNWELSQARALAVVELMVNDYGVPPQRLAAAGFGEFHPIAAGDSPEDKARNRRIEFKLTEQ